MKTTKAFLTLALFAVCGSVQAALIDRHFIPKTNTDYLWEYQAHHRKFNARGP